MEKTFTTKDKIKIAYDVHKNSGQWIVLVHGAGGDLAAWNEERAILHKAGFSTLALDLRGHGKSTRPNNPAAYVLSRFANDIIEILETENIDQPIIIGHCFGGVIALMLHKQNPKLAKGYVLVDSTDQSPPSLKILTWPWLRKLINTVLLFFPSRKQLKRVDFNTFIGTSDWDLRRIFSDIQHTGIKSWLMTYEKFAEFDGHEVLKTITQPVLIIEGAVDSIMPPKIALRLKYETKKSILDLVPNANHIIVINQPNIVAHEIKKFSEMISK